MIEKIVDRNFPDALKLKPWILCLNPATNFYIALFHLDLNETVAQVHHHKLCVIPAMIERQGQAILRDIGGLQSCVTQGLVLGTFFFVHGIRDIVPNKYRFGIRDIVPVSILGIMSLIPN